MKIVQLTTENFKRISVVHITPEGAIVEINGRNGQGKSSVIDSIAAVIGGDKLIPEQPVRIGTGHARIVCELDDLIVTRHFIEGGKSTLTVTTRDGSRVSTPQAILDRLCGRLTFDPLAFTRMPPKQQADALKALVGLNFAEEDRNRQAIYDDRALINKEVKQMQGHLEALPYWKDAPQAEVSITELAKQLRDANAANAKRQAQANLVARATDAVSANSIRVRQLKESLAEAESALSRSTEAHAAHSSILATMAEEDTSVLNLQIGEAEMNNQKIRENITRAELHSMIEQKKAESADLTGQIEEIDRDKAEKLANAPFPVPGLGFTDGGVTFGGLPFSQCSAAEQMRISVSMGLAMNPKLRILLIRDGSLLDSESLAMIGTMAEKHDAQIWIERVTDGSGTGVIIEDGTVLAKMPEI